MKPTIRAAITALITALALLLSGCGGETFEIEPTSTAPAISGKLTVEEHTDTNYRAHLDIKHMPLPQNIKKDLSTYVVWVHPQGTDVHVKAGHLRVTKESRKGDLTFTTPHPTFELIVTAEKSHTVNKPKGPPIVAQQVAMR